MADKKKKTIKEALAFLNRMLSGEAAELNNLKKKVGKGWLTKGMYENSVDVYKGRRKKWNKDSRDLKNGNITPDKIYSDYSRKYKKYAGVQPLKQKIKPSGLSYIETIVRGPGTLAAEKLKRKVNKEE